MNPARDIRGPNVYRMIYGAPSTPPRPVLVQRLYNMPRNNIGTVMDFAHKLDALMQPLDVHNGVAAPAVADDHEMMGVVYRFNSLEHWVTSVDQMVENEEFAELVSKANELGTLTESRMLVAV